jgi:hypothetical protein
MAPAGRVIASARMPGGLTSSGVLLMLLAGLTACTVKRPEGDSIDVPPVGLFSGEPRPGADPDAGPGGARGPKHEGGDLAARQPDYRPLPDAPGMQVISSGLDPNASDDDADQKDDGRHYVIPDTQVSYGSRARQGTQPGSGQSGSGQ